MLYRVFESYASGQHGIISSNGQRMLHHRVSDYETATSPRAFKCTYIAVTKRFAIHVSSHCATRKTKKLCDR